MFFSVLAPRIIFKIFSKKIISVQPNKIRSWINMKIHVDLKIIDEQNMT